MQRWQWRAPVLRAMLLLPLLPLGSCRRAAPTDPRAAGPAASAAAVETYLRTQMRINRIPSIAVAIVRDGTTELLEAWGTAHLEWAAPATPATAYQLASATKPLTGTALMLLVQEGALSLDSSVRTWLPEAPAAWDPITIRHLATHASGISDDVGDTASNTAAGATLRLMEQPLAYAPGSRSSYGIGGYIVLQHIIERIAGTPFPQFMHDRIFVPLDMTSTRFDHGTDDGPFRTADIVPQRAQIYTIEGDRQRISWFHYASGAYSAGGLLSSAADLAKWAAALDRGALLREETAATMWETREQSDPDNLFAIGWAVGTYRGRHTVGHSGGPALADILRFAREKLTIIVLTNQSTLYPYLAQGVADLIVPTPQPAPTTRVADAHPALSATFRRLLVSLAHGLLSDEPFTDDARRDFLPQVRAFLPPFTRSLGEPDTVTLIAETRNAERWERTYLASYDGKPVLWRVHLAPDGRIRSLRPFPQ
ncbi:MAG TPA: serine hydrolase domain-containing protein [Longimicrobiales bacterium]